MAQIGDILAKLGRRETLTTAEQQKIRLWGNQSEASLSVMSGIQNGMSDLFVNTIKTNFDAITTIYTSGVMAQDSLAISPKIPQNFSHLLIFSSGRVIDTSPAAGLWTFGGFINYDYGSNYGFQRTQSQNTTVVASKNTSTTLLNMGLFAGDDAAAGVSYSSMAFIPNYRGNFHKTSIYISGYQDNTYFETSVWRNTSPIKDIYFAAGTGFKAGSIISIFGIQ